MLLYSLYLQDVSSRRISCAKEVSILQRASKGRFAEMTRVLADDGG